MTAAFTTGFGLGFLVAAQVGPVWLLCARSVLRGRVATGLAIGAAAALVDTAYAALGIAGAASLLEIAGLRIGLGLVGAAFLVYLGSRTVWQGRGRGMETLEGWPTRRPSCRTRPAANPSTIISWAAIFTAAHTADVATSAPSAGAMLLAIGLGSFSWFLILSLVSGALGARLGERVQRPVDVLSGLALAGFGAYLGWSTLHDT
jgi:threonine/homoserine/homoserine lactone efflux protein